MSIADKEIDYKMAEPVAVSAPAQLTQIMIIAQEDQLASQLSHQMASDDAVQGWLEKGTLTQVMSTGTQDWSVFDFVVFELSNDFAADVAALEGLQDQGLQFVAVSQVTVPQDAHDALLAAGVAQVLVVPTTPKPVPASAPKPAPAPEIEPKVQDDVQAEVPALTGGCVTVMLRARGGAGATTIAVNLAVELAGRKGAGKTVLVDLDLQNGSIGLCLDMQESEHMTAFVKGEVCADQAFVGKAMQTHASGLDVLTAPDVFAPLSAVSAQDIAGLIDVLKAHYDHIILDMPQAVIDWLEPALERAARVLVVTDMSVPSIKRTRRLIDLVTEEHMTLPIETVVNFEKQPRFPTQTHKEAARLIGRPLKHWVPADARAARRATDMGVPLQIGAKRCAAAKAITALSQSLFDAKRKG